jgi:nitroreductase
MSDVEAVAPTFATSTQGRTHGTSTREARTPEAGVDSMFVERWSPRSFLPDPIDEPTLKALFEAARWAPSANNEQPWLFLYATRPEDRARFAEGLAEMNRLWAAKAPVLVYLIARRTLQTGPWAGKPNPTAGFDSGAAWMSLALQAHLLGLSAHAMGGIDREKAAAILQIPEGYDVLIAIAIGRRGHPSQLPDPLVSRERPSTRRPLGEVAVEGSFPTHRDGSGAGAAS